MKALIVIPARFASTRFEGKPLVNIAGKSMIQRTYEQALKAPFEKDVYVATDDQRIFDHVIQFGQCIMTSPEHQSGSDRCFEVFSSLPQAYTCVINLQGDEPFIQPQQIELLYKAINHTDADIATLQLPIQSSEELFNPNVVKVISNLSGMAMLFSRQSIPYIRGTEQAEWHLKHQYYRHIGMYGFNSNIIPQLMHLPLSPLEQLESLEQLRWLDNGYKIHVSTTDFSSPAVDSPEDLKTVDNFLKIHPEFAG
jgi:3-deoxy-manno-octulosonate cytidylyltransferase (CMP-KDO synthetase)